MKRMFFEMPIVAMVVMMSVVCSCGNSGNANQDQSPTDSVVDESAGMEDADVDVKMIEKRLHEDVCKYLEGFYTEYCKTFFNNGNVNKLAKDNLTEKLYKEYKNGYQPDEVGYTTDIVLAIIMGSGGMVVPDRCQNINVKRGDGDYIVEALYESEFGGEKRSQTTYHVKVVEEDGRFLISEIESDEEGNIHE